METPEIKHHAERRVFELLIDGRTACIEYEPVGNGIRVTHTYVPPELGGQGIAGQLARFVLESARKNGWWVEAGCPYFQAYLGKHPEYADLHAESVD